MKKGFILIFMLFFTAATLSSLIFVSTILIKDYQNFTSFEGRQKSFYLAVAGATRAEFYFKYDPPWQPTDEPFSGKNENLIPWLVKDAGASGSIGKKEFLKEGGYKIIWEKDKNYFYVAGFLGASALESSLTILKIAFDNQSGFKKIKQEEI